MFLYSCPSVSPFQTLKVRQTPPRLCYNPPLIPAALGLHETMPGNDSSAAKRARIPQRGPQAPRFIVIDGPLRVGKTTLARVLAERLHARRIYDCEDNPFLADFYKAKPEVLRARIAKKASRDESHIAAEYIEEVARAYEHFFFRYAASDLLVINTSDIDFVERSDDLQLLLKRLQEPVKGTQYFLPLGAE